MLLTATQRFCILHIKHAVHTFCVWKGMQRQRSVLCIFKTSLVTLLSEG